jgi:riboflavin biosynthesis pyrimidine reductase
MVATLDGRASLAGRSAPISGPADRELFHALRTIADGVLVGAATVRGERYGPLIRDEGRRSERVRRGRPPQPLACIVSASLDLDPGIPLLADADSRVIVLTASDGELAPSAAEIDYVRTVRGGVLDLGAALAELRRRHGITTLLCEGGPHLAGELAAAGLLHELYVTIAPILAGEPAPGERDLRILAGALLDPAIELRLTGALQGDAHLFLRYAVVAPERVSRETIPSSSPAS